MFFVCIVKPLQFYNILCAKSTEYAHFLFYFAFAQRQKIDIHADDQGGEHGENDDHARAQRVGRMAFDGVRADVFRRICDAVFVFEPHGIVAIVLLIEAYGGAFGDGALRAVGAFEHRFARFERAESIVFGRSAVRVDVRQVAQGDVDERFALFALIRHERVLPFGQGDDGSFLHERAAV